MAVMGMAREGSLEAPAARVVEHPRLKRPARRYGTRPLPSVAHELADSVALRRSLMPQGVTGRLKAPR